VPKILIRSGKDPFTPVGAEATLTQDVFNTNVGNYLFADSVHKTLMTPGTDLVSNGTLSEGRKATARAAARVNEEFDAFVIPLANAFRPEFTHRLENLTSLVRMLEIPVVVVGVGAQASIAADLDSLSTVRSAAREFVSAVLDRSASVGVRGRFTADFLTSLGFPESSIDVIGCPSLFFHGPEFRLPEASGPLHEGSRLALTVTDGVPGLPGLVKRLVEAWPSLVYIGQDKHDLRLMLWGEEPDPPRDARLPFRLDHPLYTADRVRFPLSSPTWLDFLRSFDLAVGTRLHGSVAALLAGTPATLLVHDSRTLELAELHALPSQPMGDLVGDVSAQDLLDAYDPAPFNDAYPERFAAYTAFLERNGLEHIHAPGKVDTRFDDQVAATRFPPMAVPLSSPASDEVAARLRWLRDGQPFDSSAQLQAYTHPFPVPLPRERSDKHKRAHTSAEARIVRLERQLAVSKDRLQKQGKRVRRQGERLDRQAQRLHRQAERIDELEERLRHLEEGLARRVLRRMTGRPSVGRAAR
jgi:hypothetical protein